MNSSEYAKVYQQALAEDKQGKWAAACKNYKLAGKMLLEEAKKLPMEEADPYIDAVRRILERAKETESKANRSGSSSGTSSGSKSGKAASGEETALFVPVSERPNVRFEDIAGLESVKQIIRDDIIGPRKHPELYERFRRKTNGGILMYGVPGTGKTMLARCIATETDADFFVIKCSDIVDKYVGEAEKRIRALFDAARESGNAIIMFDEFDAIGKKRGSDSNGSGDKIVNELLVQMDGFEKNPGNLLVIAATNIPWMLDTGLTRPPRMTHRIHVPLPDAPARRYLLNRRFNKLPCQGEIDIEKLVRHTEGWNGADLDNLVEQASTPAIRRGILSGEIDQFITQEDVDYALKNVHSSVDPADVARMKEYNASMMVE